MLVFFWVIALLYALLGIQLTEDLKISLDSLPVPTASPPDERLHHLLQTGSQPVHHVDHGQLAFLHHPHPRYTPS
jgi:hypothetical protein